MAARAWPELNPWPGAARDLGGPEEVVVGDDLGGRGLAELDHGVERHHLAVRPPRVELTQVPRTRPELLVGLDVHPVGAVVEVEVVHVLRPEEDLEGVRHFLEGQPEAARLVTVDVDHELRVVGPETREQALHLCRPGWPVRSARSARRRGRPRWGRRSGRGVRTGSPRICPAPG